MEYTVERVQIEDEFKVCPGCGYQDGFHAMLKKDGDMFRWMFICPSCHGVYDVGYRVRI